MYKGDVWRAARDNTGAASISVYIHVGLKTDSSRCLLELFQNFKPEHE